MQGLGDLSGGLALRPGVRHSQSCREARGGEEKIALLSAQLTVELNGKGVKAPHHGGLIRRGRCCGSTDLHTGGLLGIWRLAGTHDAAQGSPETDDRQPAPSESMHSKCALSWNA